MAYWTVTQSGNEALWLNIPKKTAKKGFPQLKSMKVTQDRDALGFFLQLELLDEEYKEPFVVICRDIVDTISEMTLRGNLAEGVKEKLRLWANLMRKTNRMSETLQQGLLGELTFLRDVAIPAVGPVSAIESWRGADRGKRDFVFGSTAVEVKSTRGGSKHIVHINSAEQLAYSQDEALFLYVLTVDEAIEQKGMTLQDMVLEMKSHISDSGKWTTSTFDSKLVKYGYKEDENYTDLRWSLLQKECYAVKGRFPRVTPDMLPSRRGVQNMKTEYDVDLSTCRSYKRSNTALIEALLSGK